MLIVQKLYIWNHHIIRNNCEVEALEKHYVRSNFEEKISFEYCKQRVYEYLKNVSTCKKLSIVNVREYIIPGFFCEHLIPVPTFAKEVSLKSISLTELFQGVF